MSPVGSGAEGRRGSIDGQFSIERDVDDCVLHLAYSYRGEAGTFVVARVAHLALGLGLAIEPSSPLRHVFFKDVEVDIAAWDRAHHVVARSAAQAIPFLRAVIPAQLDAADELGSFVCWTDREIMFERLVSNVDADDLGAAAGKLLTLARAIAAARERIAAPDVATSLDGWHALALYLDGRLTIGDLSIQGKLDGLHVDLGIGWDSAQRATSVHVAVGDPEAAGEQLRAIAITLAHPAAEVLGVPAADQLVDQLVGWPDDLVDLRIADGVARAALVLPPGDRPVIDVGRVRELVEGLRAVLATLEPGAGPYR